jgi:hypothetical protein
MCCAASGEVTEGTHMEPMYYEPMDARQQLPLVVAGLIAVLAVLGLAFVWPW